MSYFSSWNNSLLAAIALHLALIGFLLQDQSHQNPVTELAVTKDTRNQLETAPKHQDIVEAVSVDSKAVQEAVTQMKNQKLKQEQAMAKKQAELKRAADLAVAKRIEEQKKLEAMKRESAKLEAERKKRLAEEQKKLAELAQKKVEEEKRIKALQQKELEQKKLAEEKAAKERAENLKKKQAEELALKQAREADEARKKQVMAGVVDKYKSMIISAISEHWILPDNTDSSLSSQFRIRLAPDGTVLDVSLSRSSGDPVLDLSAKNAIYKASPLPVPKEPDEFAIFRDIVLTVRPEQVRG